MIKLTANLLSKAEQLGLGAADSSELREELVQMVTSSAPVTHPRGNRRYKEFVFRVERDEYGPDELVTGMSLYAV